ncbi:MAG: VacJ family lipoprotein [Gammaproteobacteria bacterium]|nr:VacJ family lipoprotein [Gammaproteobacteria bacterium]
MISSFAFSVPRRKIAAVIFSLLLLSPLNVAYGQTADPWENTNRTLFRFNDYFDTLLVKPIATTYLTLLPSVPRRVVRNFFSNIDDVNVAVNDLLQFKFDAALSDSGRILINTTVGLLGVIDVATSVGLEKNEEDFGQTFAYWGVPSGPYLVIPTKGPSSVRDAVGFVLDTLFNPLQYSDAYASRSLLYLLREIDYRSSVLALDELMFGDKYIFVREAHIQRREYLVADGLLEDVFADF